MELGLPTLVPCGKALGRAGQAHGLIDAMASALPALTAAQLSGFVLHFTLHANNSNLISMCALAPMLHILRRWACRQSFLLRILCMTDLLLLAITRQWYVITYADQADAFIRQAADRLAMCMHLHMLPAAMFHHQMCISLTHDLYLGSSAVWVMSCLSWIGINLHLSW
jgi:hypothetical protein